MNKTIIQRMIQHSMKNKFILTNNQVRENCINFIRTLPADSSLQVEIKEKTNSRTLAQNALYWMWLKEIAKQRHEAGKRLMPDAHYHMAFRALFLGQDVAMVFGLDITEPKSTTKLNTKEFTEYLENIEHYMGSEEGISLPHPSDTYYEAMQR